MSTDRCNRVLVERYFLGETGPEEKRAVRGHLDGCAACRGLMATYENERREYLMAHPFREFAARQAAGRQAGTRTVPEEADGTARRGKSPIPRWIPALAGLGICLSLVPVAVHFNRPDPAAEESGIRAKGGLLLEYYVKRGGALIQGSALEPYRPGDELQFVYGAGGHAYVTLASLDSRGHVSLYRASGDGRGPISVAAAGGGGKASLPFAVTLDGTPGSELFVMRFGAAPLAPEEMEGWLLDAYTRASGNLDSLASRLSAPSGESGGAGAPGEAAVEAGSGIRVLLLRKTGA